MTKDIITYCGKEVDNYQICQISKKVILHYKDGTIERIPLGLINGLVRTKSPQPHSHTREEISKEIENHIRKTIELQYELDKLP